MVPLRFKGQGTAKLVDEDFCGFDETGFNDGRVLGLVTLFLTAINGGNLLFWLAVLSNGGRRLEAILLWHELAYYYCYLLSFPKEEDRELSWIEPSLIFVTVVFLFRIFGPLDAPSKVSDGL